MYRIVLYAFEVHITTMF